MKTIVSICLLSVGLSSVSVASELPPEGSKPLVELLKSLESSSAVVTEAEFDDGALEVTLVRDGTFYRLDVDPRSGETRKEIKTDADDRPPEGALPLSEIVEKIDAEELGTIIEIEFDHDDWEAELRKDEREIELKIDPRSGEIKRD